MKLEILLHEIRAKAPDMDIHVVAFSLGSAAILPTVLLNGVSEGVELKIGEHADEWRFSETVNTLTLVAPAERSSIAEMALGLRLKLTTTDEPLQNIFVMRSQNDWALRWATFIGEDPFGLYDGCNERLINEIRWIDVSGVAPNSSLLPRFWKKFEESHYYLKHPSVTNELKRIFLGNELRLPQHRFDDCSNRKILYSPNTKATPGRQ